MTHRRVRRRRSPWPAAWSLACGLACGGARPQLRDDDEVFACRERAASYLLIGGLAGAEVGVSIDCAERGPRVRRWVVDQRGGRDERSRSLAPDSFDEIWERLDGAGWRHTSDCAAADSPTDPVYTFDFKDASGAASFSCAGRGELPFPYHGLVDELDLAARGVGSGDDGE